LKKPDNLFSLYVRAGALNGFPFCFRNKYLCPSKNIAVAMSGGVDSSVTAALLKAAACVFGITMRLWDGASAIDDAGRVAAHLRLSIM
jgi:PP-loop superfamily ATP-utilizing enzyme